MPFLAVQRVHISHDISGLQRVPYQFTTLFQSGFTPLACTSARGRGPGLVYRSLGEIGSAHPWPCHVAHPPHAPLNCRGTLAVRPRKGLVYRGQGGEGLCHGGPRGVRVGGVVCVRVIGVRACLKVSVLRFVSFCRLVRLLLPSGSVQSICLRGRHEIPDSLANNNNNSLNKGRPEMQGCGRQRCQWKLTMSS